MQKLRIFAASASDTTTERAKIETVAGILKPLADNFGIVLDVMDWRSVVPDMGRPEQVILDQLKPSEWDVLIGILWHRFGTPPGGQDPQTQRAYLSGTEEEFKTAYRLWKQHGKPRIMMYRCTRPLPYDVDFDQVKRVRDFFAQFEAVKGEHQGLYQTFDTPESFERLLLDNLQRLLIDYGEQLEGKPVEPQVVQSLVPKIPDNLPRRTSFFGRDKEMDVVLRALSPADRTWGVLVDGIGGIGKTALAVEAAYRCKEKGLFKAFIFVSAKQNLLAPGSIRELTPVARTLDEFLNETAHALGQTGIAKLASDGKRRALLDALRELPTLLIYDNLETLTKDEQEAMADFLRDLPQGCKAVITSRRRGGEGAVWLRLEKLDWDAARQLIIEEAGKDAGLRGKLQRAGEARWQELYDATGGSPLALSHTLGLMRVRAALTFDGALEMLRGNRDSNLQEFIFQEARRELTTNDQAALRALSFFALSATFEAWMEVAQLSRSALETTIDRLSALSLVDVLAGEERYALHPLTRNFVRKELLADMQIALETGMRFADYWVSYSKRYGGRSYNYRTFNLIEAEWPNLNASAEWLWQAAEVQSDNIGNKDAAQKLNSLSSALCGAMGPLYYFGLWDESLQLSTNAYEAMHLLGSWAESGWRAYQAAWIYLERGNNDEAECWADHCVEAWARGGTKIEQARGSRMRGLVAYQKEEFEAAEQLLQNALIIFRNLQSDRDVSAVLDDLGGLERNRNHLEAAEQYYREALALDEKTGSLDDLATQYNNLGLLALDRARWAEAREWYEKGLPLVLELGRQDIIVSSHHGLARVREEEGHPDLALPLALTALEVSERLHHRDLWSIRELVERLKKKLEGS